MDQNPVNQGPTPPGGSSQKTMWIVIGIIILALIAWFAMSKKSANNNQTKSAQENAGGIPQTSSGQGTFNDLLMAGKSQTCDINFQQDEKTGSQGTVYLASGKVRGDYTTQASEQTIRSHFIIMDKTFYSWMDGQSTGFKSQAQATSSQASAGNSRGVDENQKLQYNCRGWSEDNSKFSLPSGITFSDMSAVIKTEGGTTAPSSGSNAAACSACNSLSGDQKTQCLTALACK